MGWAATPGSGPAGTAVCPTCPGGRLRCQRQKRFLPTPAGPEVQAAPPSPVSYLRYAAPRTLGVPLWGLVDSGRSLTHGQCKLGHFVSQGRPLLRLYLSCSGPRRGGGLGHPRTAWNNTQLEGLGHCAGLGGGRAVEMPLSWLLCGGNRRPVWLRTAFQPGIRHLPDDLDLSMCRSLSHKETNKKLKIKTVGGGGK